MDIFEVLLSNAVVVFVTAPLRRIRFLLTVEDDLVEEGVLPAGGFGGVWGCVRFLYTAGGRSITIFYRGALLEAGLGFVKYGLQRVIAIPISRRLHLDMRQAFLVTTLLHTTLTYLTVTPVQTAVDTIIVNDVTDFTPVSPSTEAAVGDSVKGTSSTTATGAAAPRPQVRPRFAGSWATTRFLAQHFPVLSMVSRLYLLEFGCRYASSLVNNKILGYLVRFVEHHRPDGELTNFQRLVMYAGCPLLASLAVNLLTYPIATYPLAHFLRLRYYERRATTKQGPCKTEKRFSMRNLLCRVLHSDVQQYLSTSMYGRSGSTPTAKPATGGAEGKRGLAKLYRGYGLVITSTLLSAGLAMAANTVTSRVVAEITHH